MGSLLFTNHIANFYDKSGNYIGTKTFKIGFRSGCSKRTFVYKDGTYNIKTNASRSDSCYFPFLIKRYFYTYSINNPDPIVIKQYVEPLMNADDYNVQLESKVLRDLNNVRQGGLMALLTPRNIIIILIIIGVIFYFASGGQATGGEVPNGT